MWLYYWLASQGIHPLQDVNSVIVPPPQMLAPPRFPALPPMPARADAMPGVSGSGVLRDPDRHVLRKGSEPAVLTPAIETFLREPSRAIGEAVGFLTSPLPGEGGLRPGATEEAATRVAAAAQKAEANVFVSISEGKADDTVATGIQAAARNAARARRAVRNTPAADVAALRAFYEEYDAELVQLMDGEQKFAWSSAGVA